MTKDRIVKIIEIEAHKNLIIVDSGTKENPLYSMSGVDLMAKSLVRLLNIDSVSFSEAELICEEEGCGHPLRVQRICTNKDCICYEY